MFEFQTYLRLLIGQLLKWEKLKLNSSSTVEIRFNNFKQHLKGKKSQYSKLKDSEKLLINRLFDLFSFKHRIGSINDLLNKELNKIKQGKYISFLGPLGVGKSTLANVLIKDLKADFVIHEPYTDNSFWKYSQKDSSYMLRSQLFFLFSNIFSDIDAKLNTGRSVSDTSALSDSLMWAEWYRQTGHLNKDEYKLYRQILKLFKDIIPRPDLLVALIPNQIADLKQGIVNRQKSEKVRSGELVFTSPQSKDLENQTLIVKKLVKQIPKPWRVKVLSISVNPLKIYKKPVINYDYIYQIRYKLGLLGEFLNPQPEEVITKIRNILAEGIKGQVIIIHAKSMFTGKTTVLCRFAEKVGEGKVIAFQPRSAVRWEKQENEIVSRDGSSLKAFLIEDNNLESILKFIEKKRISSRNKPFLLIDEIMLFNKTDKKAEAAKILEKFRRKGFQVIIDGIDYTFQEEPFSLMHDLLIEVGRKKRHWHAIEMSTRCRYCNKVAFGTRRIKKGRIANYNDIVFLAGDSEAYEPVCCIDHKSCRGQPADFVRQKLPV